MPRANRHFLPDQVWHITHRCHQQTFLLKFARDRDQYLRWLFEAKKRFGLCVLDYAITSNHVHLLIKDTSPGVIAQSMQLIAGRTGRDYNQRKARKGAYWEDRYHATAIEADEHLRRCLVYIDLNMVRAGVVTHPAEWTHGGYRQIQHPPKRYGIVDLPALTTLCGFASIGSFQEAHHQWVDTAVEGPGKRDERWSTSLAVGNAGYVERIRSALRGRASHRSISETEDGCSLRESSKLYLPRIGQKNVPLSPNNTRFWEQTRNDAST